MAPSSSKNVNHVRTVDFARGLCAFAVFGYHILYYEQIASLDIVSFYAVYAFFVISGFAMYIAYRDKIDGRRSFQDYLLRRFWRIAPLFYTATALHLYLQPTSEWAPKLVLNFLLVFGLANAGATSIVTGGWSIGIELVFYLIFPFVIVFSRGRIKRLMIVFLTAMVAQVAFVNSLLETSSFDWVRYSQPASFLAYFAAGCILAETYLRLQAWKGAWWWYIGAIAAIMPFTLIQTQSPFELLIGWRGAILVVATIALISSIAFMNEPQGALATVSDWLGRMSYPIYLIHPLAYIWVSQNYAGSRVMKVTATILITLAVAELVNRLIERPAIRYSKRLERAQI